MPSEEMVESKFGPAFLIPEPAMLKQHSTFPSGPNTKTRLNSSFLRTRVPCSHISIVLEIKNRTLEIRTES